MELVCQLYLLSVLHAVSLDKHISDGSIVKPNITVHVISSQKNKYALRWEKPMSL